MRPVSPFARRRFLQGALGLASALPVALASRRFARADSGRARRFIVFYFPDGIAGRSQDGMPSLWESTQSGSDIVLSELLQPLGDLKRECVFVHGLSMGSTDEGSHPGGAKKLLTGVDGGRGESIDQFLARTVGASAPFRHLYLGAMANQNNASGDKFISYVRSETTVAPEDDPLRAFTRLFSMGAASTPVATADAGTTAAPDDDPLVLGAAMQDLMALRTRLGDAQRGRLDLHLDALQEVNARLTAMPTMMTPRPDAGVTAARCDRPSLAYDPLSATGLYAPENFPTVLRAQVDVMVQAMACGLTKVGVIQSSQHTSELIMSRFRGTEMYDPTFDMRSHQASHYGARQDRSNRLFTDYVKQCRWWVSQFGYLLEQLRARPEDDGTMLDHSVVLLCSEVSDGNTHSHHDMPFVVAGRGGGCITPNRILERRNARHGDLLAAIARAMGSDVTRWGDESGGPLAGLLG